MMPLPQNNSHQGNHGRVAIPFAGQSQPGSSASFASVGGGGPYGGQASGGNGHGPSRKKAGLG
jgi:cyclin-dependent kinase 8/11